MCHLHLPVQSGSDRVLAAMKRGYTALEYKSIVRRLRARRPDLSLSSDFIVGFPGETATDFAQTMRLVEDVGFDGAFSFIYSPRPGTPAADLADRRAARRETSAPRGAAGAHRSAVPRLQRRDGGHRQRVLVTGRAAKNETELAARTENNRVVNFAGDPAAIGTYADVRITVAMPHSLRGERIADPAPHDANARVPQSARGVMQ